MSFPDVAFRSNGKEKNGDGGWTRIENAGFGVGAFGQLRLHDRPNGRISLRRSGVVQRAILYARLVLLGS